MPYVSKSIDNRTAKGILKDFMDRRMSYQALMLKYELPIRDIKFHLSTQLDIPQNSLISYRSLNKIALTSKGKIKSKVIGIVVDILAFRLHQLISDEEMPKKTFREIGNDHGVSKQRVEQIQAQVVEHLEVKLERNLG
jgi:hypothetical protein